jgi:Bacterial Ig domain
MATQRTSVTSFQPQITSSKSASATYNVLVTTNILLPVVGVLYTLRLFSLPLHGLAVLFPITIALYFALVEAPVLAAAVYLVKSTTKRAMTLSAVAIFFQLLVYWFLIVPSIRVQGLVDGILNPDYQPPAVFIDRPNPLYRELNGQRLTIEVEASDNVSLRQVELSIDGVLVKTYQRPPYSYEWDISKLPSGTHTVEATARDGAGNSNGDKRTVIKN